ncbi:hypothetical protein CK247_27405 [Klebsiella pneumoniae]|nr:hypothetical protein CK247_27405 [Klebsiella pneumoniae]
MINALNSAGFFQEDIMLQRYRFELLLLLLIVCALFTLRLMFK